MTRHRHLAAGIYIAGAFLALLSTFGGNTQAADESAVPDAYGVSDLSITADLSNVPDFSPVLLAKPYKKTWQNQLLSYQARFVLTLQSNVEPIDQLETGSITR